MNTKDFLIKLAFVIGICIFLIYLFKGINESREKDAVRQHEIAMKYIEKGYVRIQPREGTDLWLKYESVKTKEAEKP